MQRACVDVRRMKMIQIRLPRAMQLRRNLTAYDGNCVALVELRTAPLLTRDARIARGAERLEVVLVR